ncbi:MAG: hypothetical protein AAFV53_39435 [Myxococcota bacterium]
MFQSLLLFSGLANAGPVVNKGPIADAEEYITTFRSEPPNIIFAVDVSGSLNRTCHPLANAPAPCSVLLRSAILEIVEHNSWANFGLVTTSSTNAYTPVVAVGASREDFISALETLNINDGNTDANMGEVLSSLSTNYLNLPVAGQYARPSSVGNFEGGAFCSECQNTHVIAIMGQKPTNDDQPSLLGLLTPIPGEVYPEQMFDNVIQTVLTLDHSSSLPGTQQVIPHALFIDVPTDDMVTELYTNITGALGVPVYKTASSDKILGDLALIMEDIRAFEHNSGFSAPVVTTAGDLLLYSFHESIGAPSMLGHLKAYELETDPTAANFGQPLNNSGRTDGALWDAGEELATRVLFNFSTTFTALNENDRDGEGERDLYTFVPEITDISRFSEPYVDKALDDMRMPLDSSMGDLLGRHTDVADELYPVGAVGETQPWDIDVSGVVDESDFKELLLFIRGTIFSQHRYSQIGRSPWVLADSGRAEPAFALHESGGFSADPTYQTFLDGLAASSYPDIALQTSNNGMLHAFELEEGKELWGWVPANLLYDERGSETGTESRLIDLMWFGHTRLMQGSPRVQDIWIDSDNDGNRECDSFPDDCEWKRVVLVSQGQGGPAVLALDITDTASPRFLFEHVNPADEASVMYAPKDVQIMQLQDGSRNDWVAVWGNGPTRLPSESASRFARAELTLYQRAFNDNFERSPEDSYEDHSEAVNVIDSGHYPPTIGNDFAGTLPSSPAAVDLDDDGVVDVAYVNYVDNSTGVPRASLYKIVYNNDYEDLDDISWCEMYSPYADLGVELDAFYPPTVSRTTNGTLNVYWGTGTPYQGNLQENNYFFAFEDPQPRSCPTTWVGAMNPICGASGNIDLGAGTRLTDAPIVFQGAVYFTTWTPDAAGCGNGTGQIFGVTYNNCAAALADPFAASSEVLTDSSKVTSLQTHGYPSSLTISDQGHLLLPKQTDGVSTDIVSMIKGWDPMNGTQSMGHMMLPY